MNRYPLATSSWGPEEPAAIADVVASDQFTMGARVARFEREFAAHVGSRHAVMVNSGSSANLLMVAVLCARTRGRGLRRGDEVIVPAVSWPTTYCPFQQYGIRLKFVDIDAATLNYDMEALAGAIDERTAAIMAVNLLGNPNDFAAIRAIIGSRDIILVEDNCESLGATFEGKHAGTFGLMGTYSTFFSHHMSTMEGGLLVTDDEECHHLALAMRAHGWTRQLPKQNLLCNISDDPFMESYRFVVPGYNLRPLEIEGALGSCQLAKLSGFLATRKANAGRFVAAFADHPHFTIQREVGSHSWFGFSLLLRDSSPWKRPDVVARLRAAGIETRPIVCGNYVRQPAIRYFDYCVHQKLVNADRAHDRGLFVGNNPVDLGEHIEMLQRTLV